MIGPNGGANGGADEVRDTIVPQDALPDVRDTVVPQDAPAPSPFQRDADVRVRRGLALGGGLALLVAAAALAPLVVVGALLPRDDQAARPAARVAPPVVDFGALRTAIPAAPTPQVPTVAAGAAREQPDPSLRAFARLANRVYEAREAWRKAGQAGKELFRTASVDDLGGAAFVEEMELGPRRFVWLRREAKVLAPAGTLVPDGVTMKDAGNDTGPASFDGTLEGKPVRAIRTCLFGESYCLVDVVEQATPAAAPAAAPPPDDAARLATFDAVAKREADKLAAWAPPAPATTTRSGATPLVALAAAAALALVLAGVAVSRLRNVAATVVGASARLRAAAAGRIEEHRADAQTAAELADLQAAVDEAARALGDGAARAEQAARRRARLGELTATLAAAAAGRLEARAPASADDDPALAALAAGTNAAVDSMDARVLRWRSHAAAAAAGSSEALRALHAELTAVSTSQGAPAVLGALRDLPAGEIARRLPEPAS